MAVDPVNLRQAVSTVVLGLDSRTHPVLTALGTELELPMPGEDAGPKWKRLKACMDALEDDRLLPVARSLLAAKRLEPSLEARFALEDAVWAAEPGVEILARTRRELARAIDLYDLGYRQERLERLLDQLWILDDEPMASWTGSSTGRRAQLRQHVFSHQDWSAEELFDWLGAFEAGAARFARFLEGLVHPATLPDEAAQLRLVEAVNVVLTDTGARLEQTGETDGYPTYQLLRAGSGGARRPKTLIFATTVKPDIRFVSVLDKDVEVLGDNDQRLIYDRTVGRNGLRWHELLDWWKQLSGIGDEQAAMAALFKRLIASMPDDSRSPQRQVYRSYHAIFKERGRDLPALLPEVWLHWDHQTVKQRGVRALLNHRMDFLLLLPGGHRVVVEVDGPHHYATHAAYANTVRGDRELKLRGYDVYRLCFEELAPNRLAALIEQFFTALFDRYNVTMPEPPGR